MADLFASIIRTSAFLGKEISEILRQPRLLGSLVMGPFLILLVFGIGYRNEARALRTLFVVPDGESSLARQIEENARTLGPQLIYSGVTTDEACARQQLLVGEVDLVAVAPDDAMERVQASEQAQFTLYHREIDPFQVDYVHYFGQVYIDEVNRRVLLNITQAGQSEASGVQEDLRAAAMRQALQAGDSALAGRHQAELNQSVGAASQAVGASLGVLNGIDETIGAGNSGEAGELLSLLASVRENAGSLGQAGQTAGNDPQAIERLDQIEQDLGALETRLEQFTAIDPNVLVRPFRSQAESVARVQPNASEFFSPAVIALLLQHLAVTMAALSIVRERTVGTMELFRISPLSAGETLIGKYLSNTIFSLVIAAALSAPLIYGLRVPMLGSWLDYGLVIVVLLFASLGIGFIISLISQTESQAVQLTMLVLLTSVFFSGFLMSLDLLTRPVRALSWALPTTYGIALLRDIFFRGLPANLYLLGGLALIGLLLYGLAWLLLRRLISNR